MDVLKDSIDHMNNVLTARIQQFSDVADDKINKIEALMSRAKVGVNVVANVDFPEVEKANPIASL